MKPKEDTKAAIKRWDDLLILREHYKEFPDFLRDVVRDVLGFKTTRVQWDIGDFISDATNQYIMVQAQRGESKTTIAAIYGVWSLIHDPTTRILIISAGQKVSKQIAGWIMRIIATMPELACLRPDSAAGDRTSVEEFDVHHTLRGNDKSPSVACLSITTQMQGYRADLVIADDIESKENSRTAGSRELILDNSRDFTSICSKGRIIYLGTPQSKDSIYNTLPGRGFVIRVWPGRYPTVEEMTNYGDHLAPMIANDIALNPKLQTGGGIDGKRGRPTDPDLLPEHILIKKELDQSKAYFQLQHMLDTKLMDADRYPLKASDIVFMEIPNVRIPVKFNWSPGFSTKILPPTGFPLREEYYQPFGHESEFTEFSGCVMYIDPAGGGRNGDQTGYAVTKFAAGTVYATDVGGIPGGYSDESLEKLAKIALKWQPRTIIIEENYGKGAFARILTPILRKHGIKCHIEEVWESGQKELRIVDILEPLISTQRLVIDKRLIQSDWAACQEYSAEKRITYSLFFQIARLTRDKGSLAHDDKLDALAGSCRYWVDLLLIDRDKVEAKIKNENYRKLMSDPLGNGRSIPGFNYNQPNFINKIRGHK